MISTSRHLSDLGQPVALGVVHCLVDATTVTVVMRAANIHDFSPSNAFALVLAYDVIAFGSQVLLGALADRSQWRGIAARVGLAFCVLAALALQGQPLLATLCAGLGNALFHVGAGALVLSRGVTTSAASGLFVAPGALGLAFGITYGALPDMGPVWPLPLLVMLGLAATWRLTRGQANASQSPPAAAQFKWDRRSRLFIAAFALLLVSVAIRSLVGFSAARGLPKSTALVIGIPLAAFLGKGLGGLLADRLGWLESSVFALLLSIPCLAIGFRQVPLLLLGLCLFQMTMPVTLTAAARLMPHRLGTAFGWTCLALIVGALPTMFRGTAFLCTRPLLAVWIIVACAAVGGALTIMGVPSWLRPKPLLSSRGTLLTS